MKSCHEFIEFTSSREKESDSDSSLEQSYFLIAYIKLGDQTNKAYRFGPFCGFVRGGLFYNCCFVNPTNKVTGKTLIFPGNIPKIASSPKTKCESGSYFIRSVSFSHRFQK